MIAIHIYLLEKISRHNFVVICWSNWRANCKKENKSGETTRKLVMVNDYCLESITLIITSVDKYCA